MAYLIIDGYEVKNLVDYDDLLSTQDGENSGRNPSLFMNRDILGRILSITAKVGITPQSEAQVLLQKLKMITNLTYSKEAYNKLNELLEKEKPDLAILNLVHRQS